MGIVISDSLVLDPVELQDLVDGLPDYPLIGYNNLVTSTNVSADAFADGYPASNLAAPQTYSEWREGTSADGRIYVELDGITPIDYVGIAKHNFGSAQLTVEIEAIVSGSPVVVAGPIIPADDSPLLFRFSPLATTEIRVHTFSAHDIPRAAVLYVGKLLVMERRIWVGHTPYPHGRKSSVSNGMSENGQFLGRIQTSAWRETSAPFSLITPSWYRENMDAFLAVAAATPFFFAARPATYPLECGFGGLTDDPVPVPDDSSNGNLLSFTLNMRGVA